MQTRLADFIRDTDAGRTADAILRKCVHCGFCTATCPTYQLLGDELDGPRGRIYLIKEMLEGAPVTASTRSHLDRCLTCRGCETTCPSGVRYGRLVDIGREVVEQRAPREWWDRMRRGLLRRFLARPWLVGLGAGVARGLGPLLPRRLRVKVPRRSLRSQEWPRARHPRRVLALGGCVQGALAPEIDAAAARVLDRLGLSLVPVPASGCCGALDHHLAAPHDALDRARRNIDAWWPEVAAGAEAIVPTASACSTMVKDYGELLADDPRYREKAARIAELARDLSEVVAEVVAQQPPANGAPGDGELIAFHAPCTLQHGQRLNGVVEHILRGRGFRLAPVADGHLCCGSAGTYSVLQSALSGRLLERKVKALDASGAARIATANIGCLMHLRSGTDTGVVHWIELLDERM